MADISGDEFTSSLTCASQRFNLVVHPTGSGKSLIFQSFPLIVDELRKPVRTSCALVISEGLPGGSLFPSKIALCFHVPVRFPHLFPL